MAETRKTLLPGELWELKVAAGLRRWGFLAARAVGTRKRGIGDVIGVPFLVECKAHADASWRPGTAQWWVDHAAAQAKGARLPFAAVLARPRGALRLEAAVWLLSPESADIAVSVLPELAPLKGCPAVSVSWNRTIPSGVVPLAYQG